MKIIISIGILLMLISSSVFAGVDCNCDPIYKDPGRIFSNLDLLKISGRICVEPGFNPNVGVNASLISSLNDVIAEWIIPPNVFLPIGSNKFLAKNQGGVKRMEFSYAHPGACPPGLDSVHMSFGGISPGFSTNMTSDTKFSLKIEGDCFTSLESWRVANNPPGWVTK